MWVCPVCQAENNNSYICKGCGFDECTNFIKYITPVKLPETLQRTSALYVSKNREVIRLKQLAQNGDAISAYHLGCYYYYGYHVSIDRSEAVNWWKKTLILSTGNWDKYPKEFASVPAVRLNEALFWMHCDSDIQYYIDNILSTWKNCAIHFKDAYAALLLGTIGRGWLFEKEKDKWNSVDAVAYYWQSHAANLGDIGAAAMLGSWLWNMQSDEEDRLQAIKWLKFAADHGDVETRVKLAGIYMTQGQLELGEHYYALAAEQNNREARRILEVIRMGAKIVYELEPYATLGYDPDAKKKMAWIYGFGLYGTSDRARALELFMEAAKLGDAEAMYILGECFDSGRFGASIDQKAAVYWMKESAGKGDAMALLWMGMAYDLGKYMDRDDAKAFEMYTRAAEYPWCTNGIFRLGRCYYYGIGTEINLDKAFICFKKAEAGGITEALRFLKLLDFLC